MIIPIKKIILEDIDIGDIAGTGALTAGAGYLAHKGITTGLPKALGLRTEYHTTTKKNAKNIMKTGYLDPNYGGTGASAETKNPEYIKNSKNYVHITGNVASSGNTLKDRLISNVQTMAYRSALNNPEAIVGKDKNRSTTEKWKDLSKGIVRSINPIKNKAETLVIMAPKKHFNFKNFEVDKDAGGMAMKTKNPVKVYSNKYSALYNNIKSSIKNKK